MSGRNVGARDLPSVVADVRERMHSGLMFRSAVAKSLEFYGFDVSHDNFSAIGKELNRFRSQQKKARNAKTDFKLFPPEFAEWAHDAANVERLRNDHLLRDP